MSVIGPGILMSGTVAALAVAGCDGLGIFAACVGCLWVLGALERLRRQREPRPPAAGGRRLAVSALRTAARAALELAVLNLRAAAGTRHPGSPGAFPGLRWSRAERAALKGKRSLRYLIEDVPRRRHETGGER